MALVIAESLKTFPAAYAANASADEERSQLTIQLPSLTPNDTFSRVYQQTVELHAIDAEPATKST